LLDTYHVTLLKYPGSERGTRLAQRLGALPAEEAVGVTIITVEEQMRGWLAAIAKERQPLRQVGPYRELAALFDFFANYNIVPFDEAAVAVFETFGRIQIGAMDKKIAAIALANSALLLTANRRDFEQVPNLRFENWMDPPPTP
jgi:tRNA(fMet)-specific endonuclease VapC